MSARTLVLTHRQLDVLEAVARLEDLAGSEGRDLVAASELQKRGLLSLNPVGSLPVWSLTITGQDCLRETMARIVGDGMMLSSIDKEPGA